MRKSILIICALVLAVCFWLLLHRTTKQVQVKPPEVQMAPTNQSSILKHQQTEQTSAKKDTAKPPSQRNPLDFFRALGIDTNSKTPFIQQMWQKPINFYGKAVDENGNPVAGVGINFRWTDLTALNQEGSSSTESDSDGLFSLRGKYGGSMTLWFGKEGYYSSHRGQMSFNYAVGPDILSPDPQNPVILQLRKKGHGESLIEKDFPPGFTQIWQFHHEGTPIELDLLNGSQNVTGGGQLKLEFWRDLSDRNAKRFDWKLQISALGGGLIETNEEFAFEAPANGYQPSIIIEMPATNQDWLGELRRKYYVQLPNGNYGRLDFYLLPRNGVFTVHSAINPTGSRNLEPSN